MFDRTIYLRVLSCLILVLMSGLLILSAARSGDAKVYVDVTSPGVSRVPIAIQVFVSGKEVSDIVIDDLTYTGLFQCLDDAAQIERPDQPFNPANWTGLGVALVVKGSVKQPFSISITAYDAADGREVLRKEYTGGKDLVRPIAHTIANDVYKLLTGQQGIFRTRVAFVADRNGHKELTVADWDGQRARPAGITAGILLTPRWTTDGTKVLYSAERQREWGIYLYDLATGKERNVVFMRGLNIAGNFFPNNREFVFTATIEGNSDVYIGDVVSMKGTKLVSSPWIDVSPSVSPDGRRVLFVSNRSGSPQIYVLDRDGGGMRRVTFQGSYNTSPVWSPRGDRIAYSSLVSGRHQIFIMKLDGSDAKQLTDRGNNEEPSFSPDGRFLLFMSDREGTKGVFQMRADGEGQRRVTSKGMRATSPSWSPF